MCSLFALHRDYCCLSLAEVREGFETMAPLRKSGGALGAPKNKMKQGNLFSFFTKKTEKAAPQKAPPLASATKPAASKPTEASREETKSVSVKVGDRIEVFWPDDDAYYPATVTKQRDESNFFLEYEDGQLEWIDLSGEKFRHIGQKPSKRRRIQDDDDDVDEDSEQEFEMDDAESEGSAYVQKDAPEDEDEDDQWMVTDDEDDKEVANKKPKKALKVTKHTATKTPAKTTSASKSSASLGPTPKRVTPALGSQKSAAASQKQTPVFSRPSLTVSSPGSAPMYTKGAVNPAGSHVHNHLAFLQNPRDAQGRTRDHPDYDCRTLKMNITDWNNHCGKMTNAVKQWWDLKAQYFDTVLLFKTGTLGI